MSDQSPQRIPPNAQRVTITENKFRFTPNAITARSGEPLSVTLMNRGKCEHDWVIAAKPAIHMHVLPGESQTRMFTFETPARYSMICTLPGHKEIGMVGKLVIRGVSS